MRKWSIRDLWGRLTEKKAMKPGVRDMLLDLDGVYEQRVSKTAAHEQRAEPPRKSSAG